jgi:hypothetical protein
VELPLETGELVDKALDEAVEATASSTPELAEESWAAQRADALVALAKSYLGGSGEGEEEMLSEGDPRAMHPELTRH